jgi:hypothetical protein
MLATTGRADRPQLPEAVAIAWLTIATQSYIAAPLEQFIGAFSSHSTAWADHHDTCLGQAVRGTLDREGFEGPSNV